MIPSKQQIRSERKIQFQTRLLEREKTEKVYKSTFSQSNISAGLTFNDVLLVPQYSEVQSRSQCVVKSWFSTHIPLNIPFVSSPMDTVTESQMAIAMAREGGLGIIHRFMTVEDQVRQIVNVKRAGAFINCQPQTITADYTLLEVKRLVKEKNISSFLVVGGGKEDAVKSRKLAGILTQRDILCFKQGDEVVSQHMTCIDRMIVLRVASTFDAKYSDLNGIVNECKSILIEKKIEKIPLIWDDGTVAGLVSLRDIRQSETKVEANKDHYGRLLVGAAVGVKEEDFVRATQLVEAGCDVLVVDVANGHAKLAMDATEEYKTMFPEVDVVAGSIATGEGAENLIRSGADGVRCGIGNGSICITRVVAGSGVPQLSAIMDTAPVCKHYDIPLCSDGGNKNSGNMCKALAMGADSIMMGKLVAGCEESPGAVFYKDGKVVKMYRGMAGLGANIAKAQKVGGNINPQAFSAEGVEGYIPYTGSLNEVISKFANGIRSGMSYSGAFTIKQLQKRAKFIQLTESGLSESKVHGITQIE